MENETKFKVGDKIEAKIDWCMLNEGDTAIIKAIRTPFLNGGHFLTDLGFIWGEDCELVEEKRDRGGEGIGPSKASESQVDGNHYSKLKIQPIEYCFKNNLNVCQSKAIKYITRYKSKGTPLKDLEKAIHCLQLLIELEELRDE